MMVQTARMLAYRQTPVVSAMQGVSGEATMHASSRCTKKACIYAYTLKDRSMLVQAEGEPHNPASDQQPEYPWQ